MHASRELRNLGWGSIGTPPLRLTFQDITMRPANVVRALPVHGCQVVLLGCSLPTYHVAHALYACTVELTYHAMPTSRRPCRGACPSACPECRS